MKGLRWINVIVGLWLAVTGIFTFAAGFVLWDNLIAGIIVAIVGFALAQRSRAWTAYLAGLIGVWFIVAAFLPGLREDGALFWNNLIGGVLIAVLSGIAPTSARRQAANAPQAQSETAA